MEPHHHLLLHHQQQGPPTPPSPWYGSSSNPYPSHHPQQQQQPLPFSHFAHPPHPHPHPIPPWPPAAPDFTPGGPPPPPGSFYHPPPPYPGAPPPPYAIPPPPHPVPPPSQVWGPSSRHQQQGWDHPDRNLVYNNDDDWAARARAWAEAKSVMDGHSTLPFSPAGRTEVKSHFYDEHLQQTIGRPGESKQVSLAALHHSTSSITDYHKQASHMQELSPKILDSSYPVETRALYTSRPESLIPEKVNGPIQVNFSSNSSFFEQEVPSNYSSVSGRDNGDRYERPQMLLPLPVPPSTQDGGRTLEPMAPLQHTPIDQTHVAYAHPFPASTDASDQPLVFEQRYSFDNGQNQKINYKDVSITGSLGGMEHVEAVTPAHVWTPSVAFSQTSTVTAAQQFDSSYGSLSTVAGDHPLVFSRIPGPSFHPNIPAVAQFGLGSGAPLNTSTFGEDAGTFGHIERPKKRSVPNWLREEIIKKKASIVSSTLEQPSGSIYSLGVHDDDKSFRKADEADSKSNDSSRSVEDDELDEDEAEAARTAAINQEIKRILTDVLLKVTDELFEEIAKKVIEEDELTVEVDNNAPISKLHSPASMIPKTAARVLGSMQGDSAKFSNVKSPSPVVSLQGNLLGLANYDSDAEEDDPVSTDIKSFDPHSHVSHQAKNDGASENAFKTAEKRTNEENPKPLQDFDLKQATMDGSLLTGKSSQAFCHNLSDGSGAGRLSTGSMEHDSKQGTKESVGGKSNRKAELMRSNTVQSTSCEDGDSKGRFESVSRPHGRGATGNDVIKDSKSGRSNDDSVASDHKRGTVGDRVKEKSDRKDILPRTSKGHELKRRDGDGIDLDDIRGTGKDKRGTGKDVVDRKREQVKYTMQERNVQGERDSHRSKSRRSPSPINRAINSKDNSLSCHGVTSSGETIEDSKKRRSHSKRCSLSRSPPRSRRRQVSKSPPSKHSQRRQFPYSYSEKRKRSRSAFPVHLRR